MKKLILSFAIFAGFSINSAFAIIVPQYDSSNQSTYPDELLCFEVDTRSKTGSQDKFYIRGAGYLPYSDFGVHRWGGNSNYNFHK